ncbi:UbiA family prenyltransferase [Lactococcus raffinolactis]|jgi:1,4-dihydroxy-2-naphthoate polyprenyltransferase|uniref:UbiA family prenyltransferase n=1 Tax=Pseudolactococcus raffinolactis TaxID=1366 RepID=UPI001436DE90|nr:UbiA family prenyltransferase [Lactococcus raffinolactis]QIW55506.1 UbiA family prenyltransferase [Lactococcus raffinolactis]
MTFKTFLNFTRIQTLPAALLSPIAGVIFALYTFGSFHFLPTLLFFIGLIAINLFVSAWNNLMDYKKALDPDYKTHENILSTRNIAPSLALKICLALLAIDLIVGIGVVLTTNIAILPIGALCFIIAIFYTFGPFAFSRFPLGEVLAGFAEGLCGFFFGIYVNAFDANFFTASFHQWLLTFNIDFATLIPIGLVGMMCFCMNFNVMLADDICDLAQDEKNGRLTLPHFIGVHHALRLFVSMYGLACFVVLVGVITGVLPKTTLLMSLVSPLIIRNVNKFLKKQDKRETFILSVQNLMIYNGALAITIALGLIWG